MFCGVRLDSFRQVSPNPDGDRPVKIGRILFYFDGKLKVSEKRGHLQRADILRDSFSVDFQLMDDQGQPVACNGTADLNIKVSQMAKGHPRALKILLKTKASVRMRAASFQHDAQGQPYYHYTCMAPITLKTRGFSVPSCDIAVKVVAEGSREPLYKQTEVAADPEAKPNIVTRVVEPDDDLVTTWAANSA
jgi:hypothetical protein